MRINQNIKIPGPVLKQNRVRKEIRFVSLQAQSQLVFTCSKATMEILEQCEKSVQS